MSERGLRREWVELTLREPTVCRPDPLRSGRFQAFRRIPEFEGRWLRVVYETEEAGWIVVTAFFDRGMRDADNAEI